MAKHHLKTHPKPFAALWSGEKKFEVRKNDRGYAIGDRLVMQEWYPDNGTWGDRIVSGDVAYILDGGYGLQDGYVCMQLKNIRTEWYEGDETEE